MPTYKDYNRKANIMWGDFIDQSLIMLQKMPVLELGVQKPVFKGLTGTSQKVSNYVLFEAALYYRRQHWPDLWLFV